MDYVVSNVYVLAPGLDSKSAMERMPQITLTEICWGPHCPHRGTVSCHSFLSVHKQREENNQKHQLLWAVWQGTQEQNAKSIEIKGWPVLGKPWQVGEPGYPLQGLSILFSSGTRSH